MANCGNGVTRPNGWPMCAARIRKEGCQLDCFLVNLVITGRDLIALEKKHTLVGGCPSQLRKFGSECSCDVARQILGLGEALTRYLE